MLSATWQKAGAQTDSLSVHLDSATLVSEKHTSSIRTDSKGMLEVDMSAIQGLPQILGNTDPLHFIKLLPGVQTTHEFDAGINIQGCGTGHNDVSIAGVPLYGVTHLLGLFSVFNPVHYPKMQFSVSSSSNRLGGTLSMELPDTISKKVTGDFSVGIISTQASVGLRMGKKSHLRASVRQSYLNYVYAPWLKIKDSAFGYDFGDYNLTYLYYDGSRNKIWVDLYCGRDGVMMTEDGYNFDFHLDWGNYMGAVHWENQGKSLKQRHTIFSSGYASECRLAQADTKVSLPSYITSSGYKGLFEMKNLTARAELTYYHVMPQVPLSDGLYSSVEPQMEKQNAFEATVSADYHRTFWDRVGMNASLKGLYYHSPQAQSFWNILPDVSLSYNLFRYGKVTASYGWSQQNLFYTGLSSTSMPVEFWFLSGKYAEPQCSQWANLSYDVSFCRDMYQVSCGLYYKDLYNQVEYNGDLFDLLYSAYDLDAFLLKGEGFNAGLNIMFHKKAGSFTGWVSYSFGRALRRFDNPEYPGWYPANHERIHELNAVCAYKYKDWEFSSTFICASGRPFTAPDSYYISSGQVVAKFGEHNARRMRPYIRLDFSVNYDFNRNERYQNGINLSIVNAIARRNDIMYKLMIKDGKFAYKHQSFILRIIPSISYYHKF